MLQAQVNYWTLQENKRHNLEAEKLGFDSLQETKRHNVVTEGFTQQGLTETQRHNVASERISWFSAAEAKRHNLVAEGLQDFANRTNRINATTNYHNMQIREQELEFAKEKQDWQETMDTLNLFNAGSNVNTRKQEANTAQFNAEINQQNADTRKYEAETNRGRADLEAKKFEWQRGMDIMTSWTNAIKLGFQWMTLK